MFFSKHQIDPKLRVRFLTIQFACLGGALSSVNILMTKCIGELVSQSSTGDNEFKRPLTYLFIGTLLFSNASEIYWYSLGIMFDFWMVILYFFVVGFVFVVTLVQDAKGITNV